MAKKISFDHLIAAFLDEDTPLNPRYLYRLSDIPPRDLAVLEENWLQIPIWRRLALLDDLEQLENADMLLSFESIGRLALHDPEPKVRASAIRLLWDYEAVDLIPEYIQFLQDDPDIDVRAAAATALGTFVYLGEIEEIQEDLYHAVENRLLEAIASENEVLVQRRALEAISFSSRPEIPGLIQSAFDSGDKDWMLTAIYSMGRSADERWEPTVLETLGHRSSKLRAEAARAAGELEISSAVPRLVELAEDGDAEVRRAAIWSLSQVGGEGVRQVLEGFWERSGDEDEIELIEDALDNLAFTEDMQPFAILDVADEPNRLKVELLDAQEIHNGDGGDAGSGDGEDLEDDEFEDDELEDEVDIEEEVLPGLDDKEVFDDVDLDEELDDAFDEEDDFDLLEDEDDLDLDNDADDDEDL